ncbi:hypothetical protein AXE65_10400 [Ventosimonas gracilis]|uniref:BrnA antitoxin family protein n=1 Tax=Ventosimonas gracilis TaxID=1680762 RepID=A0A139SXI2_9GAMM|nr:BrnA antitoxin family protein [Ventosimonas gracilis]KXU39112.1 hypothetical protein AXE65_10400 [Ventosimonas gracilis]
MPKLKPNHISPTDEEDAAIHAAALADPDNPPLDEAFWRNARPAREVLPPAVYAALTDKSKPATITLVTDEQDRARQKRTGRPPVANPKRPTTIRLSPEVIDAFRATGRGWQTRIDALLREAVEQGRV